MRRWEDDSEFYLIIVLSSPHFLTTSQSLRVTAGRRAVPPVRAPLAECRYIVTSSCRRLCCVYDATAISNRAYHCGRSVTAFSQHRPPLRHLTHRRSLHCHSRRLRRCSPAPQHQACSHRSSLSSYASCPRQKQTRRRRRVERALPTPKPSSHPSPTLLEFVEFERQPRFPPRWSVGDLSIARAMPAAGCTQGNRAGELQKSLEALPAPRFPGPFPRKFEVFQRDERHFRRLARDIPANAASLAFLDFRQPTSHGIEIGGVGPSLFTPATPHLHLLPVNRLRNHIESVEPPRGFDISTLAHP